MKEFQAALRKLLRGPQARRLLEAFGVDPRRYWLLMDLFSQLSKRGEMSDQLGRNGLAMRHAGIVYFLLSALMGFGLSRTSPSPVAFLVAFLAITTFMLTSILISEAGNSLINPQEALILAHQPINGATYTGAKLSHLARIVLYFVPALNVVPAFAGLTVRGAFWYYPILHLAAAFAVGLAVALLCCAFLGWLVAYVPVRRLKAAGQLAGTLPFLAMTVGQNAVGRLRNLHPLAWLPAQGSVRWGLGIALCLATLAAVAKGIRNLSADYLIRVSSMTRGGASTGSRARKSWLSATVRRVFGGQTAVAGFAFVSRMMLRDWQFRRQMAPMLVFGLFGMGSFVSGGWPKDPFTGPFSAIHVLPHIPGFLLFFACVTMPYGNDYKGAWVFLTIPSRAIDGFVRGIFAVLWINLVLIPNLALLPLFAWRWGIGHALLFSAYSVAVASTYLGLELRLVDRIPFSKQMDTSGQALVLPLMMGGGIAAAIFVSVQYFLIFRSLPGVLIATLALALAAFFATRASLSASAHGVRYHLGLISAETRTLSTEIEV